MKVLIEIDERKYNEIAPFLNGEHIKGGFNLVQVLEVIRNGTPLNGTNGEVFGKIMDYMFMDDAYITTDRRGYLHLRGVKDDWWNADYKAGSEDV